MCVARRNQTSPRLPKVFLFYRSKLFPLVESQGLIAFVLVSVLKPYRFFTLFPLLFVYAFQTTC